MRAKAIGPLLGAAMVAALLIPGAAAGVKPTGRQPASRESKPEVAEVFEVKGTNGFTVTMTLLNRHRLKIEAIGSGPGIRGVEYSLPAPQVRGSDDIKAKIGNLGRVELSFVPEKVRRTRPTQEGCHGAKTIFEEGHFVGLISFHGEVGYTEVQTHRAVGEVVRQPSLTCSAPKPSPEQHHPAIEKAEEEAQEKVEDVELTAVAVDHGRVDFKADRVRVETRKGHHLAFTSFIATANWYRGAIKESSLAMSILQKGSMFLSPDPTSPTTEAVIKPPFPFSGSATFRRESAKSASWSGDLKVELPGLGDVPLAASGTGATMCAAAGCPQL